MLTYQGVTYHEDEEEGIVFFYTESRVEFCKECPLKETGQVKLDEETTLINVLGCPCERLRIVPSASISRDAFKALKEADALDDLMEEIKANDENAEDADLLRLGAGAGFWLTPTVAAMAELTTMSTVLDDEVQYNAQDEDEDFFHSLDVGLRFAQPQWSLGARFHLPLDDVFRDNDLLGGGVDLALYF